MSEGIHAGARVRAVAHRLEQAFGTSPFHTSHARRAGISDDRVERACAQGLAERLGRGWYAVVPEDAQRLSRLSVLLDSNPGILACGSTAAALWGMPVPPGYAGPATGIEVAFRDGSGGLRGQRLGATARRWHVPDDHLAYDANGYPATDPLRTAIDLARGLPLPFALAALDAGLRVAVTAGADREQAHDRLHHHWLGLRRGKGMRRVGLAIPHADDRAESLLESIVRGQMIQARLPASTLQVEVMGASGRWYRSDMGLDLPGDPPGSHRLLIEADGLLKYQAPEDLADEKKRQHDLERRGHVFVRVLYREGVYEPEGFLGEISRRLHP